MNSPQGQALATGQAGFPPRRGAFAGDTGIGNQMRANIPQQLLNNRAYDTGALPMKGPPPDLGAFTGAPGVKTPLAPPPPPGFAAPRYPRPSQVSMPGYTPRPYYGGNR
jgi:hypothetical protein